MTLFEHLSNFKRHSSEEKLTAAFEKLAPHFIYGGYIKVNDAYRVYIRTIEFYYHDESDKPDAIKDPIMYHRNHTKEEIEGPYEEPYLPLMSIYMHSSGYDITFENEEQEYRASALIREYSIYDVEQKEFLRLTSKGMFRDERVLYLKYYLNGFSLNGNPGIVWVDDEHFPQSNLLQNARKGVYIIKDGKKTTEKDKRQWSFKLNEDIWLPTD